MDAAARQALKYEIPELSERMGVYVTADDLEDAKRIAREHGCDAVWEVKMFMGMVPLGTGRIHAYRGGAWEVVPPHAGCPHA